MIYNRKEISEQIPCSDMDIYIWSTFNLPEQERRSLVWTQQICCPSQYPLVHSYFYFQCMTIWTWKCMENKYSRFYLNWWAFPLDCDCVMNNILSLECAVSSILTLILWNGPTRNGSNISLLTESTWNSVHHIITSLLN